MTKAPLDDYTQAASPTADLNDFAADVFNTTAKAMEPAQTDAALDASLVVMCFSHLRWDFVYQRPQHLLTRFARRHRVFFCEEPKFDAPAGEYYLETGTRGTNVWVVTPHLPPGRSREEDDATQAELLQQFMRQQDINNFVAWYYTPMALGYTAHLKPALTVYDCMDELANFANPPEPLLPREHTLFERADLVFTGGHSLYEAKKDRHPHVHAFPSSIDRAHFAQAQQPLPDPADQAAVARPRLGFFGVLDERFDMELVAAVARLKPTWQWVLVGPVVKIDPQSLPQLPNITYLGMKTYQELPAYLANWDVATLPFARNEATRFISPTKTPEYLAAGKPVVSTSIADVVRPYGELNLVHIADSADAFVEATQAALDQANHAPWRQSVDNYLAQLSWDDSWQRMATLMQGALARRQPE